MKVADANGVGGVHSVFKGEKLALTAFDGNEDSTYTWTTTNKTVATVKNGVVTARKEGVAYIYAANSSGVKGGMQIYVYENSKKPYLDDLSFSGGDVRLKDENGGWLKRFVLALCKPALKSARVVFFENAGNRDTLAATGVVPKGRDVVLNGAGVNLEDYPYQPYPQEGPVRFLFVGRVMHEKGVDELFAAAKRMKQEYGDGVEFHIVGSFEEEYKPLMDELEQAGVVKYHGYQSDMKRFYAMASCVVLPSYHEGMSNVLLEGAATGRALITSDIPGCREAVEDGVSGYLCPTKDVDALCGAMRRFAELPENRQAEMGRRGRTRMEQKFSKTAVVAETIKHLEI